MPPTPIDSTESSATPVISIDAARRRRQPPPADPRGLLYWTAAGVGCGNATWSAVYAVLNVWATHGQSQAALHAASARLPLAVAALGHLVVHAPASLCALSLVLGGVQLLDFVVGTFWRDAVQTGGSLLFTVLTLACVIPQVAERLSARRPAPKG